MSDNLARAHEIWKRLNDIDDDLRLAANAYERSTKHLREEKAQLIAERTAMLEHENGEAALSELTRCPMTEGAACHDPACETTCQRS